MHRHGKAQPASGKVGALGIHKPAGNSTQATINLTPRTPGVAKQLPSAESSQARAAGHLHEAVVDLSSDSEGDVPGESHCAGLMLNELPPHVDEDDAHLERGATAAAPGAGDFGAPLPALPTISSAWGASGAAAAAAAPRPFGEVSGTYRCLGCERKTFLDARGYTPNDTELMGADSASTEFLQQCSRCRAPPDLSRPAQAQHSRSAASAPTPTPPPPAQRGSGDDAQQMLAAAAALEAEEAASGSFVPSTSQLSPAPAAPVASAPASDSPPTQPPPPPAEGAPLAADGGAPTGMPLTNDLCAAAATSTDPPAASLPSSASVAFPAADTLAAPKGKRKLKVVVVTMEDKALREAALLNGTRRRSAAHPSDEPSTDVISPNPKKPKKTDARTRKK